jgi:hypothetical protein
MSINAKGYWEGLEASSQHCYDASLSGKLVEFFKKEGVENMVDLGCGMGNYVNNFKNSGINAYGYDGNPNTPQLTNGMCGVLDLSVPIKFEVQFDWVMSLEVGEHIPRYFEETFIQNLHNNNKRGIVLSWAVEGQGGHGHVNCKNNDYVKSKICKLGYTNDIEAENALRSSSTLSWFKNTIMVFRKIHN